MTHTKSLIIFLIINNINCDCPKYVIPRKNALRGHIDYHFQNLSGYPKSLDMIQLMADHWAVPLNGIPVETIRFMAIMSEPFVFAINDKNGFTVWGPLYSLLKESAKYINYRQV